MKGRAGELQRLQGQAVGLLYRTVKEEKVLGLYQEPGGEVLLVPGYWPRHLAGEVQGEVQQQQQQQ